MIGDAYFQRRAQIGTGLFSLQRLATESGAREETLAALRGVQGRLRETFTFLAWGPEGAGKSALLNALFGREFCGPGVEPATAGRLAIFQHGDPPNDAAISADIVECFRPHIFLRDFTVIEAPSGTSAETLGPFLANADVIFFVLSATENISAIWDPLSRLGRAVLKRLVFVFWQSDRLSPEEGALMVKRLRQAMLRNLAQACPIFTGSKCDAAGREKLERWIESEVILAEPRRQRLREIDDVAREAMREIVTKPRADRQALEREIERVRHERAVLADWQEQSHRQVAGALWSLAQSFDGLRRGGEDLLHTQLPLVDLFWKRKRGMSLEEFASEIETQTHAAFSVHLHDQLIALESDLRDSAEEHLRGREDLLGKLETSQPPEFPRAELEKTLAAMDPPLEVASVVDDAYAGAMRLLQWPALAAASAVVIAIGASLLGYTSKIPWLIASVEILFVALVAILLKQNIVARFGRHFTDNRAKLLAALEPAMCSAAERYYAGFAPAMEERAGELETERQRTDPLLAQLRQIEQTFSRIETDPSATPAPDQPV